MQMKDSDLLKFEQLKDSDLLQFEIDGKRGYVPPNQNATLKAALAKLDTPTSLPLEQEMHLLEVSRLLVEQIACKGFKHLDHHARFLLVYWVMQIAAGIPNGELEAPRVIPPAPKKRWS